MRGMTLESKKIKDKMQILLLHLLKSPAQHLRGTGFRRKGHNTQQIKVSRDKQESHQGSQLTSVYFQLALKQPEGTGSGTFSCAQGCVQGSLSGELPHA